MPDTAPLQRGPPDPGTGKGHSAVEGNPDRVGEELADDARIWRVYDSVSKEDDDRRVAHWNRGLDNLALFAGLFSAVTTAFIIEAQKDMKPDYSQLSFLVLNATAFNRPFILEPFAVPSAARTINSLWISSLVLSLSAALIAIMGKDWIGMYTSRPVCNPRQWAEMRTYRLRCERWYMSSVISAAPVLLHVSLLLFGAGLVLFVDADSLVHRLTLGLCLAVGLLYFVTAFSAIAFSASPFKSPATQMMRAAVTACVVFLGATFTWRKRNLLASVQRAINDLVAPGLQVASIPTRTQRDSILPDPLTAPRAQSRQSTLHQVIDVVTAVARAMVDAQRTVVHEIRYLPRCRGYWAALVCWYQNIHVDEIFSATIWTDLPAHRRPDLVADSLAWLNSASQAPDVFRALVFALGDLEIGEQVGQLVPKELSDRVRTEIRHTWMKVDYLTLSRYALADMNLPGNRVLNPYHCFSRFDLAVHPDLRCEHGLAAFVRQNNAWIRPLELANHFAEHVTQPRMAEFLIPHLAPSGYLSEESLIILANRHWDHLRSSLRLEAEIFRRLDYGTRDVYGRMVTNAYGRRAGPIEIPAFLCYAGGMQPVTEKAAVDLILRILDLEVISDHLSIAYLFSREEFWWDRNGARIRPDRICLSLLPTLELIRKDELGENSRRLPSAAHRHAFEVSLTRTVVKLLSPLHTLSGIPLVEFLTVQLCDDKSLLRDYERLEIIRLILQECTLLRILNPSWTSVLSFPYGIDILATIVRRVGHLLRDAETREDGERLLGLLAFAETMHPNGKTVSWDFRAWLSDRGRAGIVPAMQDFHGAMVELSCSSGNCVFSQSGRWFPWCKQSAASAVWSVHYGADRAAPAGTGSTDPLMLDAEPRQSLCEPRPDLRAHRLLESGAVAHDASVRTVYETTRTVVRFPTDIVTQIQTLTVGKFLPRPVFDICDAV